MDAETTKPLASPEHVRTFFHVLANTLGVSVINFTLWFAITFFVYLETRSVTPTGIIAGIFLVATAASGLWFGSIVDHHRKKQAMLLSSLVSLLCYIACFVLYVVAPSDAFRDSTSVTLWALVIVLMTGVLAGNIRSIALPTLVTILIPEDRRDRANGLVGSVMGVSFLVTSVISGLLVAHSGMFLALILGIVVTLLSIVHLWLVTIPEKKIVHIEGQPQKIDVRGTLKIVAKVPGLMALILFTTFNNFLAGVFMALMDPYGLSLVSVQMWGFLWGAVSVGLILGGLIIGKWGLGKNPLRSLLVANVMMWCISTVFTIKASIILLAGGLFLYMLLIPAIEASEQTILQKVVPQERQGRVFGFAQSLEQAASPLTAFLIGPITQWFFIPFMTTGAGVELLGSWFGTGASRGMALVFVITGFIGLIASLVALSSRYYRQLTKHYLEGSATSGT